MKSLRARWRRTAFAQYFEGLPPGDRATFWIVAVLALALAISLQKIFSSPALTVGDFGARPALPFDLGSADREARPC